MPCQPLPLMTSTFTSTLDYAMSTSTSFLHRDSPTVPPPPPQSQASLVIPPRSTSSPELAFDPTRPFQLPPPLFRCKRQGSIRRWPNQHVASSQKRRAFGSGHSRLFVAWVTDDVQWRRSKFMLQAVWNLRASCLAYLRPLTFDHSTGLSLDAPPVLAALLGKR
ncbi:hypothetical protein K458DRAFT_428351 [Lentithecium fluviatile CBS 122367]|uniref:Uncharacterized protein n=1 Tax=Lentithecium fluviatile CBS 122367 TaxID=1168545 RepID=A0A6G1JEG4_9PLEO|nr:hypothetical protein K458DRAFT_428351 [Lentithecium fluviatile CBS 122367]